MNNTVVPMLGAPTAQDQENMNPNPNPNPNPNMEFTEVPEDTGDTGDNTGDNTGDTEDTGDNTGYRTPPHTLTDISKRPNKPTKRRGSGDLTRGTDTCRCLRFLPR